MPRRYHARQVVPLLAAVLLMLAVNARAQDSTKVSPLVPGAWALQFRVEDNFTLSSFNGALLSVKHHSSERTALRLGVSTSFAIQDEESGFNSTVVQNLDRDSQSIAVTLQLLKYMAPSGRFHPFWGLGPTVAWQNEVRRTEPADEGVTTETSTSYWAAGLTGNLGIEWCPSANIGLHAEYGIFGGYSHSRLESKIEYPVPSDSSSQFGESNTWRVTNQGALLGLSVYF